MTVMTERLSVVPENSDALHCYSGVSFAGVPVAQFWAEFAVWEGLLNEKPYKFIVELGTFKGGFSLYLAAQAHARGMGFRTYDIFRPEHTIPGFVQIDIYAHIEDIGDYLSRHEPLILFCDGGNKPRELRTFATYLSPESTIVVHDWQKEMFPDDIPDYVEMVHEDYCLKFGSASRVFRVTS